MFCPSCRSEKLKVIETGREGEVILRRRECKCCQTRFNTCEAVSNVRGSRSKSPTQKIRGRIGNPVAQCNLPPLAQLSDIENKHKRALAARRRRDAEDLEQYYTDEYVDEMIPDEDIQDLMDLFGDD